MKKRILSMLLSVSMLLTLLPSAALAAETPTAGVLEIGSARELRDLAVRVNSGESFTGMRVVLTEDIDLGGSAEPWEPIGSSAASTFNGTFDGNGHIVTGLYFIGSAGGLFARIGVNGVVENLGVYGLITGDSMLGGIAANNAGTIRNCYNACLIAGSTNGAGGITAYNRGTVENCYNLGAVTALSLAGGIVGLCMGANYQSGSQKGVIRNCYNLGPVTGVRPGAVSGGIVASQSAELSVITDCFYLSGTADRGSAYEGETEELSAAQFASQSSFSSWDFSQIWEMDAQLGRPVLRSVPETLPATQHTHSLDASWQTSSTQHWHTCADCGYRAQLAQHRYPDDWSSDSASHWKVCLDCGYQMTAAHTGTVVTPAIPPTCTAPGTAAELRCSVCGLLYQQAFTMDPLGHKYSDSWETDDNNHWHVCERCGSIADSAPHIWQETAGVSDDGLRTYLCSVCHKTKKTLVPLYPITVTPTAGGSFTSSRTSSARGISILLTVTPEDGYVLESLTVSDSGGRTLPLFHRDDQVYSFIMPDGPVTVTGSFRAFLEPVIGISVPSAPVRNEAVFTVTASYQNHPLPWEDLTLSGDEGDPALALEQYIRTVGAVSFQTSSWSAMSDPGCITYTISGITGNGTLYLDLPAGFLRYNEVDSFPTRSAPVLVDNIPPRISLRYPPTVLPLRVGEEYVEYGADVTDNQDLNVQSKLSIDASQVDTGIPGTYTVVYTVTDHAGNSATAERTVEVVACPGHDEGPGEMTQSATETRAGIKTYYCRLCHCVMRTETIPAHAHDGPWFTGEQTHWRWCALCGDVVDSAPCRFVAHHLETGEDGTVTRVVKCLVCGGGERRDVLTTRYIHAAEELRQIAEDVNSGRNEYRDTHFVLANDIDLGGRNRPWVPIATDTLSNPSFSGFFRGVFDGNGHSISGLYIDVEADDAEQHLQGLFGFLGGSALIKNLNVSGSITVTEADTPGPASAAGGIAAFNYGMIQNCYSSCDITNTFYTGGIAGYNSGRILNCYNKGALFSTIYPEESLAGGIVAENYNGIVENCYNYGTVQGHANIMGGVAGSNVDAHVVSSYYLSGTVDGAPSTRRAAPRALSARTEPSAGNELTEVDFMLEDTFSGWDFRDVWTLDNSLGRPTLRAVPEEIAMEPSPPETPDIPDTPEPSDNPDTPDKPDIPDKPHKPSGGGSSGNSSSGGESTPRPSPTPTATPSPTPTPAQEPEPPIVAVAKQPPADVRPGAWYYDAVAGIYAKGIMTGVTETSFAPETPASRGMLVTMLHRLEREPAVSGGRFTDVTAQMYFSRAVVWASGSGIVTGYGDGTFRPHAPVTREQLVVMLYRYARYKGYDTTARAELSGFRDPEQVSGYAREAMSWARAQGLITGTDWGGLAPRSETTRAECAVILTRFLSGIK